MKEFPHCQAAERARATGCPFSFVNLILGLYAVGRHLSVHAALSRTCGGPTGLLAGCGFAVHILKAYLALDVSHWRATIRTYVDDIALSYEGASARDVVRVLAKELPSLKGSLLSRCMVTHDAKEQLGPLRLGPCGSGNTPNFRTEARYPSTPKSSVSPSEGSMSPAVSVRLAFAK